MDDNLQYSDGLYQDMIDYGNESPDYFDLKDIVLDISNNLGSEIVDKGITSQIENYVKNLYTPEKYNYLHYLREKVLSMIDENTPSEEIDTILQKAIPIVDSVNNVFRDMFGICVDQEEEFYSPIDKLHDGDILYEFLILRRIDNIEKYLWKCICEYKQDFINSYRSDFKHKYNDDVFVMQDKNKFLNENDVLIMTFIYEIMDDIRAHNYNGVTELFNDIISLDPDEEYNSEMSALVNGVAGRYLYIENEEECYSRYFDILDEPSVKNEIRNRLISKYSANSELAEN